MKQLQINESFFLKEIINTLNQAMIPLEIIDGYGNQYATSVQNIQHKLFIKDQKFFKALISPNAFSMGVTYVKGYFDISGSIKELYELLCEKILNTDQRKSVVKKIVNLFTNAKKNEKRIF